MRARLSIVVSGLMAAALIFLLSMALSPARALAQTSAADTGVVRILTSAAGIYHLTWKALQAAGAPVEHLDPRTLSISYHGQPIAIEVTGEEDGRFDDEDEVIFFAEPYQGRYMTHNVYWLHYGGTTAGALRMTKRVVEPTGTEPAVHVITRTLHLEYDRDYRSRYHRPRNADHWFDWPLFASPASPTATSTYSFTPVSLVPSGQVMMQALVHGGQTQDLDLDQSLALALNDEPLAIFQWHGSTDYLATGFASAAMLHPGTNHLTLIASLSQFPAQARPLSYWISPDWVEISYPALAIATENRLQITGIVAGPKEVVVSGFTDPDIMALDVSDPRHPVQLLTTSIRKAGRAYSFHFWDGDHPSPRYALSARSAFRAPQLEKEASPSTWRSEMHRADYIAIVHRSLWESIDPLLAQRQDEGLRVAKVDVQDIYDEFNYGLRDPEAIRAFLSYVYHHWNQGEAPPQYVLLVGDGHYDFTGVSGAGLKNLIPPYLVDIDPWLGETAADNRYVSLDGPDDYLPDMHIGRIPAQTPADVEAVVEKILLYESAPPGKWQRKVVFIADRRSAMDADFQSISDAVRRQLPPYYDDKQLYFGADIMSASAMRTAIKQVFDDQALMVQWFGHASRFRWGSTSMFNIFDPPTLRPNTVFPISFTYACWSGYFINIYNDWQSLAETLVLTPRRGSVAALAPAGLHVGGNLALLNHGIIKAIYQDEIERLGPAIDAGKYYYFENSASSRDLIDTSILLGDPALRIRRPDPAQIREPRVFIPQVLEAR